MKHLFTSPEHRRSAVYRTHPAYRCAFGLLAGCALVQVAAAVLWSTEQTKARALQERAAQTEVLEKKLEETEKSLQPLVLKLQEAREWARTIPERTWLTDVLSRIEKSVPPEVCLTEITLTNQFANTRSADRFEIQLQGAARVSGASAWIASLQKSFPGWRITEPRPSQRAETPSAEGDGGEIQPVAVLLLQPAKNTANP